MPPTTPLILADNLYDFTLYPTGTVSATSELTGREAFRVVDARRERSWWQPGGSGANLNVQVDLGAGNSANADSLWLDRGHNLWGKTLHVEYADVAGVFTTHLTVTVPSATTIGGDPTGTVFSVTEEGALYVLFTAAAAAHRYWLVRVVDNMTPIITGIILGRRAQLLGFSRVKDEDAMNRTEIQEMSRAGYLGTDRRYGWRTVTIDVYYIGATAYDSTIRTLRRQLFELDQPFFCAMDYGTKPERGWLYRWDGTRYSAAQNRTYRANVITGREVGPLIR